MEQTPVTWMLIEQPLPKRLCNEKLIPQVQ